MVNPVSPGVTSQEIDITATPVVSSTSDGGFAGIFNWGPVYAMSHITGGEQQLVQVHGKPNSNNYESWFTVANFLGYSNSAYVVRCGNTTSFSNTLPGTYTNATTFVIPNSATGGVSNSGIANNQFIVGPGVPLNTIVTNVVGAGTNTTVTLSLASGNTSNNSLAFLSPNGVFTAIANSAAVTDSFALYNIGNTTNYALMQPSFNTSYARYLAKWPGQLGNSLQVSQCDSANQFSANLNLRSFYGNTSGNNTATGVTFAVGNNTVTVTIANTAGATDASTTPLAGLIANSFTVGDWVIAGNAQTIGVQYMQVNSISSVLTQNTSGTNTGVASFTMTFKSTFNLSANVTQTTMQRYWQYYNVVDVAPGQSYWQANFGNTSANDEVHVVVADQSGQFTGVPGQVLEVWSHLSRATDAKSQGGVALYYQTVLNTQSNYVWWAGDRAGAPSNTALNIASSTNSNPMTLGFIGGLDGDSESSANFSAIAFGIDMFKNADNVNVSLLLAGKSNGGVAGEQTINYIADNVISQRQDLVAFASAPANTVVTSSGAVAGQQASNIINWANLVRGSSYVVLDTGYKYQYDKYNDVFRWVPLNGDIAGTCAYTDAVRDPWYSPAGLQRGKIQNVTKLAFNPKKPDRDVLYQSYINPVIAIQGQGTVLYGDKTHIGTPGAFDRINVRRLFNVLKKSITQMARTQLFEFNDEFSRAQFVSQVTPFLRDVQARRGITAFNVVCDDSNNTAQVIQANQFVGSIFVRPNYSTNFIILNFVAVPPSVSFTEAAGAIG